MIGQGRPWQTLLQDYEKREGNYSVFLWDIGSAQTALPSKQWNKINSGLSRMAYVGATFQRGRYTLLSTPCYRKNSLIGEHSIIVALGQEFSIQISLNVDRRKIKAYVLSSKPCLLLTKAGILHDGDTDKQSKSPQIAVFHFFTWHSSQLSCFSAYHRPLKMLMAAIHSSSL